MGCDVDHQGAGTGRHCHRTSTTFAPCFCLVHDKVLFGSPGPDTEAMTEPDHKTADTAIFDYT